jgi:hypothetical protein
MITRVYPGKPRLKASEAEELLDPLCFEFASGNTCHVTPAKRDIDGDRCAIAILYDWQKTPAAEDEAEMVAEVTKMLDGPEIDILYKGNRRDGVRIANEFLNPGRRY